MLTIHITADDGEENEISKWIQLPTDTLGLAQEISELLPEGETVTDIDKEYNIFIEQAEWRNNEEFIKIYGDENIFEPNLKVQELSSFSREKRKEISFLLSKQIIPDLDYAIKGSDDIVVHENTSMIGIARTQVEGYFKDSQIPFIIEKHLDLDGVVDFLKSNTNYWTHGDDVFQHN